MALRHVTTIAGSFTQPQHSCSGVCLLHNRYEAGPARPTGGVGAVACLVGPDAPLALLSRTRTTHASDVRNCGFRVLFGCLLGPFFFVCLRLLLLLDSPQLSHCCSPLHSPLQEWDFYKPRMMSEYPTVDGKHSLACYLRAVDDTYNRTLERFRKGHAEVLPAGATHVDDYFHNMVFHSPYNKLVRQSFARLVWNDFKRCVADGVAIPAELEELLPYADVTHEDAIYDGKLMKLLTTLADARCVAAICCSCRAGLHTACVCARVCACVLSLIVVHCPQLRSNGRAKHSVVKGDWQHVHSLRVCQHFVSR